TFDAHSLEVSIADLSTYRTLTVHVQRGLSHTQTVQDRSSSCSRRITVIRRACAEAIFCCRGEGSFRRERDCLWRSCQHAVCNFVKSATYFSQPRKTIPEIKSSPS